MMKTFFSSLIPKSKKTYDSIVSVFKKTIDELDELNLSNAEEEYGIKLTIEQLQDEASQLREEADKAHAASMKLREMFNL